MSCGLLLPFALALALAASALQLQALTPHRKAWRGLLKGNQGVLGDLLVFLLALLGPRAKWAPKSLRIRAPWGLLVEPRG